jgi:hypothetical protein
MRDSLVPEAVGVNESVAASMTESEARVLRRLLQKVIATGGESTGPM